MSEKRETGGFTEEELALLADKIFERMPRYDGCKLTEEQQAAVVDFITTKKKVVRWTLYAIAGLVAWVVKDVYFYIVQHLNLVWGK